MSDTAEQFAGNLRWSLDRCVKRREAWQERLSGVQAEAEMLERLLFEIEADIGLLRARLAASG